MDYDISDISFDRRKSFFNYHSNDFVLTHLKLMGKKSQKQRRKSQSHSAWNGNGLITLSVGVYFSVVREAFEWKENRLTRLGLP